MKMSNTDIDNLIIVGLIAAGFLMIIALAGASMEFQRSCSATCAPGAAITPMVDFSESCFCEVERGVWRKTDVSK